MIADFSTKNIKNPNLAKLAKFEYFYWHTSFLGGHYTLCYTPEGSFFQVPGFCLVMQLRESWPLA